MSDPAETPEAVRRREIVAKILNERAATELDPTAVWYPNVDLAAIAALDAITGDKVEEGGVVFQRLQDGQYAYSVPVPGTGHEFSLRARFNPKELQLAGLYHTHPPGPQSDVFPAGDIEMARKLRLLSFIKVLESGAIRKFDPASSSVRRTGEKSLRARDRFVSAGSLVERP